MVTNFNGPYNFHESTIKNWNGTQNGIYFCGKLDVYGNLVPFYIGKAYRIDGIRGRLLEHISERKWFDITHFGYIVLNSQYEIDHQEILHINFYKPKYNIVGK